MTCPDGIFGRHRVQTVRSECLDWTLVVGRRHLERVLAEYIKHYNTARPHRGLDLQPPQLSSQPLAEVTPLRRIERTDILGGLIHEYRRTA
jgi:hypothetical protein